MLFSKRYTILHFPFSTFFVYSTLYIFILSSINCFYANNHLSPVFNETPFSQVSFIDFFWEWVLKTAGSMRVKLCGKVWACVMEWWLGQRFGLKVKEVLYHEKSEYQVFHYLSLLHRTSSFLILKVMEECLFLMESFKLQKRTNSLIRKWLLTFLFMPIVTLWMYILFLSKLILGFDCRWWWWWCFTWSRQALWGRTYCDVWNRPTGCWSF